MYVYYTDNDIDGEAFLLLEDRDIVQLIASIGPRRKLITKRKTVIDVEQNLSSEVCSHKNNYIVS